MSNRNTNRLIRTNAAQLYKNLLKKRGLSRIQQYTTAVFNKLTPSKIQRLQRERHVWKPGDRLYKLADTYYGDPEMWWVIAWYNQKPTDSHYQLGQIVLIPMPLEEILRFFYENDRA